MQEAFGTKPGEVCAVIGPCICQDCYEVSADVAEQFESYPEAVRAGKEPGKYQLDLRAVNRKILLDAGVAEERLESPGICTCCNRTELFSHRASGGRRGNLAAFLGLKED